MTGATIDVLTRIVAWYHLVLVVASVVLNPFVLFICLKSRKLRSISTFKLLAVSSINDTLSCLEWNLADFNNTVTNFNASLRSLIYCRVMTYFLQYSTIQFGSWMLVSISLDRYLTVTVKRWTTNYFCNKRPFIYACFLAMVIVAINFNELFTVGYSYIRNDTQINVCSSSPADSFPWNRLMNQISIYFGNVIPFTLLFLFNLLIIYKTNIITKAQKIAPINNNANTNPIILLSNLDRERKMAQITRTILFITFLYIFTSFPGFLITGYYYTSVIVIEAGPLIVSSINALQFSYPAFNFFIWFFSNRLFAEEVKSFLSKLKNNVLSSLTLTEQVN